MRFLCDVHISYKVKNFLLRQGHEATHVNELPEKSETNDVLICRYADKANCVLITKDADFVDFYYIKQSPKRVLKINLGNVATSELIQMIAGVLPFIENLLHRERFLIEIDKDGTYTVDEID